MVNIEIKKPVGKWENVSGANYGDVEADADTGVPRGLGLVSIPCFTKLEQDNRDSTAFGRLSMAEPSLARMKVRVAERS